jgi:hypothetical protein
MKDTESHLYVRKKNNQTLRCESVEWSGPIKSYGRDAIRDVDFDLTHGRGTSEQCEEISNAASLWFFSSIRKSSYAKAGKPAYVIHMLKYHQTMSEITCPVAELVTASDCYTPWSEGREFEPLRGSRFVILTETFFLAFETTSLHHTQMSRRATSAKCIINFR